MQNIVNDPFKEKKETYLFLFDTLIMADYWLRQLNVKFFKEILYIDRRRRKVEFEDSIYYLCSKQVLESYRSIRPDYTYDASALYIILDDPERHRLEGEENAST